MGSVRHRVQPQHQPLTIIKAGNIHFSLIISKTVVIPIFRHIRLVNNLFENEQEFLLQKEELSITFSGDGCLAGYFQIDTPAEATMDSTQLLNLYGAALQMFIQLISKYMTCYVTPLDVRHFLIVFPLPSSGSDSWKEYILHALISLLSDGEQIVSDIFADEPAGYRSLYQLGTTEQIIGWMQTLCDGLCDFFVSEKHLKSAFRLFWYISDPATEQFCGGGLCVLWRLRLSTPL